MARHGAWDNAVLDPGGFMVTRVTAWPSGTPCWVDLGVDDTARARAFYSRLFGWDIQDGPPEAGGYVMCLKDGHPVAGIGPQAGPPGTPPTWTVYIASGDADETAGKITEAGGKILTGRCSGSGRPAATPGWGWPTSRVRCAGTRASATTWKAARSSTARYSAT